ncbi:MAG: carbon starvation protein A, partial [Verrucomicrobiota bacterium]|nr:carbon starvation protein A [Verrucomicrobiota bacterium]
METLLIALLSGIGFLVAYHTYGRWLGSKIFRLSAKAICPSERLNDGVDYVPTSKSVVFGHHFTSIAGTGPIVGPAIAIMWGWVPALLWVVLGSIFIGAVHDFGALVVSLRNNGQTVGDIAGRVLNKRVRLLFLFTLFMALTVVLAIFGLVIAAVFKQYPAAIFPCVVQIPIAIAIGVLLHRKGIGLLLPSLAALGVMYLTVIFGNDGALGAFNAALAAWPIWTWVVVLLGYSYIASVLPVWTLLQPRDYINSLQLISALALIVLGLFAAAFVSFTPPGGQVQVLEFVAPDFQMHPIGAPMIFPFLFITIACGAVSGFHCLVSSGTSSKQLKSEPDSRFVGYGSMLTEGFLATLVIIACGAGLGLGAGLMFTENEKKQKTATVIFSVDDNRTVTSAESGFIVSDPAENGNPPVKITRDNADHFASQNLFFDFSGEEPKAFAAGTTAWNSRYQSWSSAQGLSEKVGAFVDGSANFLKSLGLPAAVAIALMGVLVASFAGTTLDTACRLQRYVVQELAATLGGKAGGEGPQPAAPFALLQNKHGATIFAVAIAAAMAAIPQGGAEWSLANAGKGGLTLWPLFGATNQLLAGLSFLVITFYLWRRGRAIWFLAIPMVFMLIMPMWAMLHQLFI